MNAFAQRLVVTQRKKATWKWSIDYPSQNSCYEGKRYNYCGTIRICVNYGRSPVVFIFHTIHELIYANQL